MKKLKSLLPLILLALTAACASGGGVRTTETAEQTIARRAVERWGLLVEKNTEAAWEYLSPGYRGAHDRENYLTQMSNRPVTWTKAEYKTMECDEAQTSCFVRLMVTFRVRSSLGMVGEVEAQQEIGERWIDLEGTWYVLPTD